MVCASSVSQFAALEALKNRQSNRYASRMVDAWSVRRKIVIEQVERTGGLIKMLPPEGAFYGWLDVSATGMNGKDFSAALLSEKKVGVLPGYLFGESGKSFIRISFATSLEMFDRIRWISIADVI